MEPMLTMAPAFLLPHRGQHGAGAQQCSIDVHTERLLPVGEGDVGQRSDMANASVVAEQVDASEVHERLVHDLADLLLDGHIRLHDIRRSSFEQASRGITGLGVAVCRKDVHPVVEESPDDAQPYPCCAPGDDGGARTLCRHAATASRWQGRRRMRRARRGRSGRSGTSVSASSRAAGPAPSAASERRRHTSRVS